MKQPKRRKITSGTMMWKPDLDIVLPVDGADISDFVEWVNWSGWKGYSDNHTAYDFAAYLKDNKVVLGLPEEVPVRSVADGIVKVIGQYKREFGYSVFMDVEHGRVDRGLISKYHHVVPMVETGQPVKKGEQIATLFKGSTKELGLLVHLHFELRHARNMHNRREVNPEEIFPELNRYRAEPQGQQEFEILGLNKQPEIEIAHFKKLYLGTERYAKPTTSKKQ